MGVGSFLSTLSFHTEEDLDELFFGKTEFFLKLLISWPQNAYVQITVIVFRISDMQKAKFISALCGPVEGCMA